MLASRALVKEEASKNSTVASGIGKGAQCGKVAITQVQLHAERLAIYCEGVLEAC